MFPSSLPDKLPYISACDRSRFVTAMLGGYGVNSEQNHGEKRSWRPAGICGEIPRLASDASGATIVYEGEGLRMASFAAPSHCGRTHAVMVIANTPPTV